MHRDTTYKQKFAMLKAWMPQILEPLKKDLRNDHLKNDWEFFKRYFAAKNINKLTIEDFVLAYSKAMEEVDEARAEQIGEFIANRWLMHHTELYDYFEKQLNHINPNFQEIELLSDEQSKQILEPAYSEFSPFNLYVFAVLNSVVFPENVYADLHKKADQALKTAHAQEEADQQLRSIEEVKTSYQQQLARLQDKYEKKLSGLQKKYITDVEGLKKQISQLQRKLSGSV